MYIYYVYLCRALQAEFNVVVRVPKKDAPSPQVVVSGSTSDIAKTAAKIKELIALDVLMPPNRFTIYNLFSSMSSSIRTPLRR